MVDVDSGEDFMRDLPDTLELDDEFLTGEMNDVFESILRLNIQDGENNSQNTADEDEELEQHEARYKRRRIRKQKLDASKISIKHDEISYTLKNVFVAGTATQSIKAKNDISLYNYTLYRYNKLDAVQSAEQKSTLEIALPKPSLIVRSGGSVFIKTKGCDANVKQVNNHGSHFVELDVILPYAYRCDKKLFTHFVVKDSNNKPECGVIDCSTHLKNFNKNKLETKVKNFRNLIIELEKAFENWNVDFASFVAFLLTRKDGKQVILNAANNEQYRSGLLRTLVKVHYPKCSRENMAKLCIVNNIKVSMFDKFKKICGIDFILGTTTVKAYITLLFEKLRIDFKIVPYQQKSQTQIAIVNDDGVIEELTHDTDAEGFSIKNYDKLIELANKAAKSYNDNEEQSSIIQMGADCAGIFGNSALTTCGFLFHCGKYPSQQPSHLFITDIYVGPDKKDFLNKFCADNKNMMQNVKNNNEKIENIFGNFDMGLVFDVIGSMNICPFCDNCRDDWVNKKEPNDHSLHHDKFPFYMNQLIFDLLHNKTNVTQNCVLRCSKGETAVEKKLETLFESINLYVTFSEKQDRVDDQHMHRKVGKLNGKNCDVLLNNVHIFQNLEYISKSSKEGIIKWAHIFKKISLDSKVLSTWNDADWQLLQKEIDEFIVHVLEYDQLQIYEHVLDRHAVPVMKHLLQHNISLAKCSLEVIESVNQENQIAMERKMFKGNYHKYKKKLVQSYKTETLLLNHLAKIVMLFDSDSYMQSTFDIKSLKDSIANRIEGRVLDSPKKKTPTKKKKPPAKKNNNNGKKGTKRNSQNK